MKKLLLLLLLILAVLMGLAVALFQWLGWLGLLLGIFLAPLLLILFFKLMAGRLMEKAFMAPFKMKGAVLHGAEVRVHSVTPAPRPVRDDSETESWPERPEEIDEEEWEELRQEDEQHRQEELSRRYFHVDVTITPRPASGQGFTMWEPLELTLVAPDTKGDDADEEDEVSVVESVEIWHEGAWQSDIGMKQLGPQRLKLLVGVVPEITRARFNYYFEVFGDIDFSEAATSL